MYKKTASDNTVRHGKEYCSLPCRGLHCPWDFMASAPSRQQRKTQLRLVMKSVWNVFICGSVHDVGTSCDLDFEVRITALHIILIVCLLNDTVSSAGYIPFRPKSLGESQHLKQWNFSEQPRIGSSVKFLSTFSFHLLLCLLLIIFLL
jgi:hypothetical protein